MGYLIISTLLFIVSGLSWNNYVIDCPLYVGPLLLIFGTLIGSFGLIDYYFLPDDFFDYSISFIVSLLIALLVFSIMTWDTTEMGSFHYDFPNWVAPTTLSISLGIPILFFIILFICPFTENNGEHKNIEYNEKFNIVIESIDIESLEKIELVLKEVSKQYLESLYKNGTCKKEIDENGKFIFASNISKDVANNIISKLDSHKIKLELEEIK